ncbi:Unknown protein [Striga hermonthica]|uniref:Phytocyanin domain-containing protein n=1 Tax=Striga hermonthica TaxID=68872 RepID=A0A9N7RPX4_STRHE|nr:Unknown protein [Striga hermonthica]
MGGERGGALAAALVVIVVAVATIAEAKQYHVTWSIPSVPDYMDVTMDDTVLFVFDRLPMSLIQVYDKDSYDACNKVSARAKVLQTETTATPTVTIGPGNLTAGPNYFIDGNTNHCDVGGTKIQINLN